MTARRPQKLLLLALLAVLGLFLYYNYHPHVSNPYLDTLKSLSAKERAESNTASSKMAEGLRKSEEEAKKKAQEKAGLMPQSPGVIEEGLRSSGQKPAEAVVVAGKEKEQQQAVGKGKTESADVAKGKTEDLVHPGDHQDHVGEEIPVKGYNPREEISDLLKRYPMVIFSKSFCPYSRKAKTILLEKYNIRPPPHVVELDKHEHGAELQAALGKSTGRTTVPNILISGTSIGGGDDIAALHESGTLIDTIKKYGKQKIVKVAAVAEKEKEKEEAGKAGKA